MARARRDPPLTMDDPPPIPDSFATDFEVEDFEDWLRIVCLVKAGESGRDGQGTRWRTASLILPRSSLHGLMTELRHSAGARNAQRGRH